MTTNIDEDRSPLFNVSDRARLAQRTGQYTLWQILGIWLAGGAPLWILSWLVYPAVSRGLAPADAGLVRIGLIAVGLAWESVLAGSLDIFDEPVLILGEPQ